MDLRGSGLSKKRNVLCNATLEDVMRKKKEEECIVDGSKEGLASEAFGVLVKQFFSIVRTHNQPKKASEAQRVSSSARKSHSVIWTSRGMPRSFWRRGR